MYIYKDGTYRVSVRNLIEFVLRSGDIDSRVAADFGKNEAMLEGAKLHRKIQKDMGAAYTPEVMLRFCADYPCYSIMVEGRADGIIDKDNTITIDEIKTMYGLPQFLTEAKEIHKAQALCYAYMYLKTEDKNGENADCKLIEQEKIGITITYCDIETLIIKRFKYEYTKVYVIEWFEDVLAKFNRFIAFTDSVRVRRNASIKSLEFPYEYRKGQKELVIDVYRAVKRECNLFIEAPTGVGKTLSTVFPSVKALGENLADKIFYLTAKTITRTVAYDTFSLLMDRGLYCKCMIITAKEKICPLDEMKCNPEHCHYAKGHYDRINEAVYDIITHEDMISREIIEEYTKKHEVCPFEFSLDISYWCDAIICDYNYVFSPNVYLKRFFAENTIGGYIFLVDEAHNLVERARDMYSAALFKEDFLDVRRMVKDKSKKLSAALGRCNNYLLERKREAVDCITYEEISEFERQLARLYTALEQFMEEYKDFEFKEEILEFYFNVRHFLNMAENREGDYILYSMEDSDGRFFIKEYCVNPSGRLKERMEKGLSTIFFSATLLPVSYFKEMLSDREDYAIYATSVFDTAKRKLMISSDVTSKYTRRNCAEYNRICHYIENIVSVRPGNYFVFFPSYKYMLDVYEIFGLMFEGRYEVILQENNMSEEDREGFLSRFTNNNDEILIGFLVTGGIFSEGIDMKNDSLIGNIIVGTGLPQVCTERELLREYFNSENKGYEYAYVYPGMNKIMQAAGRLIRTEEDQGVIALLDERFLTRQYKSIFPREWEEYDVVNVDSVQKSVKDFWEDSCI